ncbi:MAG: ZIP family metal transporter [Jhaorihella sp.]
MVELLFYSTLAGAMIPLGGWLATIEHFRADWLATEFRHGVIAFGGGALLSAVALVLIPEGTAKLPGWAALLAVTAGAVATGLADAALARKGSNRAQLLAMLSDFIPEALALGALLVADPRTAPLLALMIGLQNLPEGFNAYREVQADRPQPVRRRLAQFCALGMFGPLAAVAGYFLLPAHPEITGAVMCAAAGGILFLMFQDIAPQVPLESRLGPPLGAVGGFVLGLAGHLMIG